MSLLQIFLNITGIGTFTIMKEADSEGASRWGLLKSYQKKEMDGFRWITQRGYKCSDITEMPAESLRVKFLRALFYLW